MAIPPYEPFPWQRQRQPQHHVYTSSPANEKGPRDVNVWRLLATCILFFSHFLFYYPVPWRRLIQQRQGNSYGMMTTTGREREENEEGKKRKRPKRCRQHLLGIVDDGLVRTARSKERVGRRQWGRRHVATSPPPEKAQETSTMLMPFGPTIIFFL